MSTFISSPWEESDSGREHIPINYRWQHNTNICKWFMPNITGHRRCNVEDRFSQAYRSLCHRNYPWYVANVVTIKVYINIFYPGGIQPTRH